MITRIQQSEYLETLWKNGQGKTSQIALFPETSTLLENNFLWRISSALVGSSGPFSHFLDCERQLIIWKGEGLMLGGHLLEPYCPITFSGEEKIECELIGLDPVIDLGIIYKKGLVKVDLRVETLAPKSELKLDSRTHFLFLAKGDDCAVNGLSMNEGDTLLVEAEKNIRLKVEADTEVSFFVISITL